MERTIRLAAIEAASTPAVTEKSAVFSSTRNDMVRGPPTITTPNVAIPARMQMVGSGAKAGNRATIASP